MASPRSQHKQRSPTTLVLAASNDWWKAIKLIIEWIQNQYIAKPRECSRAHTITVATPDAILPPKAEPALHHIVQVMKGSFISITDDIRPLMSTSKMSNLKFVSYRCRPRYRSCQIAWRHQFVEYQPMSAIDSNNRHLWPELDPATGTLEAMIDSDTSQINSARAHTDWVHAMSYSYAALSRCASGERWVRWLQNGLYFPPTPKSCNIVLPRWLILVIVPQLLMTGSCFSSATSLKVAMWSRIHFGRHFFVHEGISNIQTLLVYGNTLFFCQNKSFLTW